MATYTGYGGGKGIWHELWLLPHCQQCCHESLVLHAPTSLLSFLFPSIYWTFIFHMLTGLCPISHTLLHLQLTVHFTIYWSNSLLKPWIWSNQNPKILKNHLLLLNYHDLLWLQHLLPLRLSLSWRTPQETSSFYKERQFGIAQQRGEDEIQVFLQKIQSFCWRN